MVEKRKWLALGCVLLIAALAGCSGGGTNIVGKWKGKIDLSKQAEKDKNNPGAQLGAAMASGFASMMSMELKADKTFSMTMMMFPIEGNWVVSGDLLTLEPTKVMGMSADQARAEAAKKGGGDSQDMNKPMTFKISPDGKTLTVINDKPDQPELVFERESS